LKRTKGSVNPIHPNISLKNNSRYYQIPPAAKEFDEHCSGNSESYVVDENDSISSAYFGIKDLNNLRILEQLVE
jgi:hypothetical protein